MADVTNQATFLGTRTASLGLLRKTLARAGLPLLLFVALIAFWEYVVQQEIVNPFLLAAPSQISTAMTTLLGEPEFWSSMRVTATETLLGFGLATGVGISLGAMVGMSSFLRRGLQPYIVLFQCLPKTALAPTFVVWFGFGMTSKVVHAAAIAFFPVFINTVAGLDSVGASPQLLMSSYGASKWQRVRKLSIPNALPFVFAGLKIGISFALIGAIVSEFLGAREGIGFLIQMNSFRARIDNVFALMAYLSVLGLVLYGAIAWLDKKVIFWRGNRVH